MTEEEKQWVGEKHFTLRKKNKEKKGCKGYG